ncbi:MAG: winged helix-turn-helix transcriptional regulator [Candidatus Heimdallarchaeaceae archaeon]
MTSRSTKSRDNSCKKLPNHFPCFIPAQRVLNLISKKWCIQLIYILKEGKSVRYKTLKEKLQQGLRKGKISDATLSSRLTELVEEEIVIREVFAEIPPKVEYYLTEKGQVLAEAITPLINWTIKNCHKENHEGSK